ncbi:hypothetical protein ER308_06995 [Egibacter rhizosphaerae]|uniref:DNA polymerase III subunit delta n=1 Tax=Egibacter rhizosphaerae TaxID=1670831 RepID=A0A411YDL5_9ACTN|nr:hypothetical protein [Egibacter rhizosphaerae]QBI19313.1 hypothetical protein ER308_06995 [Egibacter rhizosphaerae]
MTCNETLLPSEDDPWVIPGQDRAAGVLREAAKQREPGHAWAFVGPRGVGQDTAVRALTATLVCASDAAPCGACPGCDQALRGVHAALQEFPPTGSAHRVDDVRERWLPAAFRSSADWKVLRIPDADRMTDAAANAFLKGLEEPPPRTLWLLEITDPQALPDTVLSRCRTLRFVPLGVATLEAEAARVGLADPTDAALAARVCLGEPARLGSLATTGLEPVRRHRALLARLREHGAGQALVAAKEITDELGQAEKVADDEYDEALEALRTAHGESPPRSLERALTERRDRRRRELRTSAAEAALDDLAAWYRDVLLVQTGGDPSQAVHADAVAELREDADALAPAGALESLEAVLATRDRLETAITPRLALEALFLDVAALMLTHRIGPPTAGR